MDEWMTFISPGLVSSIINVLNKLKSKILTVKDQLQIMKAVSSDEHELWKLITSLSFFTETLPSRKYVHHRQKEILVYLFDWILQKV